MPEVRGETPQSHVCKVMCYSAFFNSIICQAKGCFAISDRINCLSQGPPEEILQCNGELAVTFY